MTSNTNKNLPTDKQKKNKPDITNNFFLTIMLSSTFLTGYYIFSKTLVSSNIETVSISELNKKYNYDKISVIDNSVVIAKKNDENGYYKSNIPSWEYFEKNIDTDKPIYFEKSMNLDRYIGPLISLGILGAMIYAVRKNMGGFKTVLEIDKSVQVMNHIKTKFKDIIGQNNAKKNVEEFVDILKNREKYLKLGVNVPKGALLSGPPGTGKTLLAKAIAGESNLPFINMVGSDFNAMFVGVGSSKIKNLYTLAKQASAESGGCIIFIDEIDAIGQKRSELNTFGGNSERENTLNQLLTEMDGFEDSQNVLTFAATNRPELLDPALLRPGRFDRKITVDIPTINDRIELFKYYLEKLSLDKTIIDNISSISSKLTPGFTGADIKNVVNEAGIISVRNKKDKLSESEIKDAIDYVMMGNEKEDILTTKEKEIVAYHEAGHAFLSFYFTLVENPIKVSIIPREKGMLGFSQSEVSEENLYSKNKIEQLICVLMGGRASEEIFCGDVTNGASNDIEKATELAETYYKKFGFNENNKFMNYKNQNPYKNETSNYLSDTADKEICNFLNDSYEKTKKILIENKEPIEKIKSLLLDKKTIYQDDITNILSN